MAAKLTVVYWRDIPAQIRAQKGRERHSVQLSMRFQEGIDQAAMYAGKYSTDDYLEDWRQVAQECGDDVKAEAEKLAAELEAAYSDEELELLVKAKGLKEGSDSASSA